MSMAIDILNKAFFPSFLCSLLLCVYKGGYCSVYYCIIYTQRGRAERIVTRPPVNTQPSASRQLVRPPIGLTLPTLVAKSQKL